ncbi:MAG: Gfo/Idh/MocA family oxidoreductase, partial [Tepidisphaeraceae bacterium]
MTSINRREFLGAAAGTVLAAGVHAAESEPKKLRLGLIGCGGYGMADVRAALKAGGVEIVAVCDVDSEHLDKSAADCEKLQGKKPATFKLYEEMLKQAAMDAVIIGTPPHWHALQFIAALNKGLDIYCEKPLAYDIREGRATPEIPIERRRRIDRGGILGAGVVVNLCLGLDDLPGLAR